MTNRYLKGIAFKLYIRWERILAKVFDSSTSDVQFIRDELFFFSMNFRGFRRTHDTKQLGFLRNFVQHYKLEVCLKLCDGFTYLRSGYSQSKGLWTFYFHIRARSVALESRKGPHSKHSDSHSNRGRPMRTENIRLGWHQSPSCISLLGPTQHYLGC